MLSEYCWYIKKGGDPDHVCFEPDGRFSYNSLEADKGTWSLQGNKLSLAFADGRTKVWTIEFLTALSFLQDGKVRWEAEMN